LVGGNAALKMVGEFWGNLAKGKEKNSISGGGEREKAGDAANEPVAKDEKKCACPLGLPQPDATKGDGVLAKGRKKVGRREKKKSNVALLGCPTAIRKRSRTNNKVEKIYRNLGNPQTQILLGGGKGQARYTTQPHLFPGIRVRDRAGRLGLQKGHSTPEYRILQG